MKRASEGRLRVSLAQPRYEPAVQGFNHVRDIHVRTGGFLS